MAVAIVNGIFSPWVLMVFLLYPVWYPSWAPAYAQVRLHGERADPVDADHHVAGVPAALYERLSAAPKPVVVSSIWLAVTVLLTLPAIPNVLRALGGG